MAEPRNPIAPPLLARIDDVLAGVYAHLAARYPGDSTDAGVLALAPSADLAVLRNLKERKHS